MSDLPVEAFLASYPPEQRAVAEFLRRLITRLVPDAIERLRPGWRLIGYDIPIGGPAGRSVYFAFVAPEVEHVHLGFEYGMVMDDVDRVLVGNNLKRVRYVTLRQGTEVSEPVLARLVREGARVAAMSRGERLARLLDRDDPQSPNLR